MSTTYAGDPTNYPTSITIPSDGDGPGIQAADVNTPFEGLKDAAAFLHAAVAPLASIATLRAINTTAYVTGWMRNVRGVGWYYFDSAGTGAEVDPHLVTPTTGGGRWKLLSHMPLTRSVFCPFVDYRDQLSTGWSYDSNKGGAISGPATTATQGFYIPPGCLHDGALLSSIDILMRADPAHSALPAVQPKVIVGRFRRIAGADALPAGADLLSVSETTAAFATIGAYENSGNAVEFTHTCTTNRQIDLSQYEYTISLTDENGANSVAGNLYWGARLNFTSILPGRWA